VKSPKSRRTAAALGAAATATAVALGSLPAQAAVAGPDAIDEGPSTTVSPYVVPVAGQVDVTSLLTTNGGAAANGYRMVGIPDGLGAYSANGRVTVLMNHELRDSLGIVRAHGQRGAFVSKLVIDKRSGEVLEGSDFIQPGVRYWDYPAAAFADAPVAPAGATSGHAAAFSRFCSGYLTEAGQLYSPLSGSGYRGRLYLANEESGDEGRVFGVTMAGKAFQLPRLGLFSWENTIVAPTRGEPTVVLGNEDASSGQLRVYVGRKLKSGTPVQQAGLTNGTLFVVDAVDEAVSTDAEFRATYGKGVPAAVSFGAGERLDWTKNGVTQNAEAASKGLALNRVEDGAFDPRNPNDYYFLTTEGGSTAANPDEPAFARDGGGLWRLRFADVEKPWLGGTLELLLDGSEAPYLSKPDNMTIDRSGNLLIQEDPGGNDHVARIVAYRITDGARGVVAEFDPILFAATNPAGILPDDRAVLTTDEESSGIIDTAAIYGPGSFLFDAQVHSAKGLIAGSGPGTVEELVENGQLLLMKVRNWAAVYGG